MQEKIDQNPEARGRGKLPNSTSISQPSGSSLEEVDSADFHCEEYASLVSWEQNLLCRKFDCEDGPLCRLLLKLIFWRKKVVAERYLGGLARTRQAVSDSSTLEKLRDREKMWEQVLQKIHNEERAARLLGLSTSREHAASNGRFFASLFSGGFVSQIGLKNSFSRASYTIAAVTASLVGVSIYIDSSSKVAPNVIGGSSLVRSSDYVAPQILADLQAPLINDFPSEGRISTVSENAGAARGGTGTYASTLSAGLPKYLLSPVRSLNDSVQIARSGTSRAASVEWMRSNGSVHVIEDGGRELPIFWVSRKADAGENQLQGHRLNRNQQSRTIVRRHQ